MRTVKFAAVQFSSTSSRSGNNRKAELAVRDAAREGCQVILLQELFETIYIGQKQDAAFFQLATTLEESAMLNRMQALARELRVVLPVSFFERAGEAFYNSVAVFDADGSLLGVYRKSHIPDGPGYQEKFYFSPGDTGLQVFQTAYCKIGIGICWDQWFPELARCLVLKGAEVLLYPTAIGSEPHDPTIDSRGHWQRVMQGHAAANLVPVVCANRVGNEAVGTTNIEFYGHSFIASETGEILVDAQKANPAGGSVVIAHAFDLDAVQAKRTAWGIFRDRRPELYGAILTKDGKRRVADLTSPPQA